MAYGKPLDIFDQARLQAVRVVGLMDEEIDVRQRELATLMAQAEHWEKLLGNGNGNSSHRNTKYAPQTSAPRTDWFEVLASVPTQFTTADVLKHPGAKRRPRNQLGPAIDRWVQKGSVKRLAPGVYEKLPG